MLEDLFDSMITVPFYLATEYLGYALLYVLIIVGLVAAGFMLWHIHAQRDDMVFTVTLESLGEQSEKIRALLTKMKATKREVTTSLLLLEEIVVRLHENVGQCVTARVSKFFGDISVSLSAVGEEYNPFESLKSWDTESEDYIRDMIFRANKTNLSYSRVGKKNYVTIRAHRAGSRAMQYTFIAMVLGILAGFGMKWLPTAASAFIANGILSTIQTIFMNSLSLLLAPVVFFSIATSLSSLSGGGEIGRIGGKTLGMYFFTSVVAILIGFALSAVFFSGEMPQLPQTLAALPEKYQSNLHVSASSFLIGIVPRNLVSPILEGNMLQIIFVAILAGFSLSALGEKTAGLRSIFEEADAFFQKMMSLIVTFMPLVAFAAIALLVFGSSAETLLMLLVYVFAMFVGCVVLFILYSLLILVFGRISPIPYVKKTAVYLITPFMLPSSSACIPMTLDFCKKKLGVSNKIASFSIPLGATVNMNGGCIHIVISVIMLAKMCGIEFDASTLLKLGVMTFVLAAGAPGIPGATLICIATALQSVGLPIAALGVIIGIDQIITRLRTAFNINGDIAASVVVAKSEGELDAAVYSA